MKKFVIVLIAAIMAIGFSAFTVPTLKDPEILYYKVFDPEEQEDVWHEVEAERCPDGNVLGCQVSTPDGMQQVYESINGAAILRQ